MWMLYMSHPYKLEDLEARVKPEFKQCVCLHVYLEVSAIVVPFIDR